MIAHYGVEESRNKDQIWTTPKSGSIIRERISGQQRRDSKDTEETNQHKFWENQDSHNGPTSEVGSAKMGQKIDHEKNVSQNPMTDLV